MISAGNNYLHTMQLQVSCKMSLAVWMYTTTLDPTGWLVRMTQLTADMQHFDGVVYGCCAVAGRASGRYR